MHALVLLCIKQHTKNLKCKTSPLKFIIGAKFYKPVNMTLTKPVTG